MHHSKMLHLSKELNNDLNWLREHKPLYATIVEFSILLLRMVIIFMAIFYVILIIWHLMFLLY